MKKYLILFISIFSSFFLIDNVNAADNGTSLVNNTDFRRYSITYEEEVNQGSWEYIGDLYGNSNSSAVRIYYNKNSRSMLGFKLAGALHITDKMSIYEYINGFEFTNLAYISSTSSGYRNSVILSSGDLPILGGDCASGSFCFMWRNSGLQGNRQSATIRSNTIFLDYLDLINNVVYGSSRFYDYDNGITYVGLDSNFIELSTSNMNSSNFKVYSTQEIKNNGNYTIVNDNLFTLSSMQPEYDYEIMPGSEKGQRVLFEFSNFNENSYISIRDLSSGTEYRQDDLLNNTQFDIDNISYDSIFYYEIYNYDDVFNDYDLIGSGTINIYSDFLATGQPIVKIDLDKEHLVATLGYYEIKDDYLLYYAINDDNFINIEDNPENLDIVHLDDDRLVIFPNSGVRENNNYVLRGRITDSNGRILYDIGYNVVFFPDKPYFSFVSSYNSTTGANEVEITLHNFQNNDIVYYSYDNVNFNQFENINVNKLEVYSDTDIYTKVVRGNNTYYGFYHVNLNAYNNSSNSIYDNSNGYNDNLFTGFKNLFTGVDLSFLSNISTFFNALKGSYVFRFIMLCITGALILFIMRMIRR